MCCCSVLAVSQLETRDSLWRVSWSLRRTPQGVSSVCAYSLSSISQPFLCSSFCFISLSLSLSLSIAEGLYHKSLEYLGSPMVYELVEYAKDCLTDNNRPCGQCAICQFDFEVFQKPYAHVVNLQLTCIRTHSHVYRRWMTSQRRSAITTSTYPVWLAMWNSLSASRERERWRNVELTSC